MKNRATPQFLDGAAGRLFSICHLPVGEAKASYIFLPPFGEELNRCRNLVSEQARRLSAAGIACLILDLFGTGDSEGASADGSFDIWQQDVLLASNWMEQMSGQPTSLWGLRLGGLLALDIAANHPGLFPRLLLWQPVTNGQTYITQLLRQRVAALASNDGEPETTAKLKERLNAGETLDVGGYVLGPRLTADVDALKLAQLTSLTQTNIFWLEHSQAGQPSPAALKGSQQLARQSNLVTLETFASAPLWQLHAREDMSDLYEKTMAFELA